jgi:hypothetical protein
MDWASSQPHEAAPYYLDVATGSVRREWCDRCSTSARLVVTVYALLDDGPHPIGTWGGCTSCDVELHEP